MGVISSDEHDYSGSKDESDIKDDRLWTLESQFDPRTYGDEYIGSWLMIDLVLGYHIDTTMDLKQS